MSEMKYPPGCKEIHTELSSEELCRRLKQIHKVLQDIDQKATEKYKELCLYLGSEVLVEHDHEDVQLLVACCLAEVFRIYAPESPYQDHTNLKKIFMLFVNTLKGLKGAENTSFQRFYTTFLTKLELVNTFLYCLELEDSQDIIVSLFEICFKVINEKFDVRIKTLLFDILHPLLNESDQMSTRILDILFARIIEPQKSNNKEASIMAVNLIRKGNQHFEFFAQNHLNNILLTSRSHTRLSHASAATVASLNSSESGNDDSFTIFEKPTNTSGNNNNASNQFISDKLCLIIYELAHIRLALLDLVMPQLEYKLKSSDLKERREYTRLLSKMFSEKESKLAQQQPQLWEAYLERFADTNEDIRKICILNISDFLIQQADAIKTIGSITSSSSVSSSAQIGVNSIVPTSVSSPVILEQIMEQVKSRSLDSEENLRVEVVQEILKALRQDSQLLTATLLNILKDRTLDIKIRVRKLTLQGLAAIYKKVHSKTNQNRQTVQLTNWIPSKIMRIYFQESAEDKLLVERLLNSSIVPYGLVAREKMAQLYYAFTTLEEYSVLINLMMKSIIERIETAKKPADPNEEYKLETDILLVSHHLLEPTKGQEFMKAFVNLLKTNLNLRGYFKNLVNVNSSCNKSMQLINSIINNIQSLSLPQSQSTMAKRLIERMSSLIIDKECLQCLIQLVEYKVKQKLTHQQRKLMSNKKKKKKKPTTATKGKGRRGRKAAAAADNSSSSEDDENDDANGESDASDVEDDLEANSEENDDLSLLDDENDDSKVETTDGNNDRELLKHIDDDGEKGLKLIQYIMNIHGNYGFANVSNYQRLFTFVNSSKEHIVSASLKLLGSHFSADIVRANSGEVEMETYEKVNASYLGKLKYFCKNGKPKQAKHAVHLIFNNFEKTKSQKILFDLYKELIAELELKQSKTFVTCLVSLGHICLLAPKIVGKEIKEFFVKSIVKDILMQPMNQPLEMFQTNETSGSVKRKNNLKLAGKWCENEDELPFNTRARIESIKLITRWCIGLKSDCPNIVFTLKMLIKLMKENVGDALVKGEKDKEEEENGVFVSEAEKSRIRVVCASQLIRIAQEPSFKGLITAEFFHSIAKLIIDPVTNVREILIKKIHKGLKSLRLPMFYMSMFILTGLDVNRERKAKVKKLYVSLIKMYRVNDAKEQALGAAKQAQQASKVRILPEMCLSYAVSLLAHNVKLDSLKDEHKVKQIKECMHIMLDPLLENPDANQIALVNKILNKIKVHDDGLAINSINSSAVNENEKMNKIALQNLALFNRSLIFICEIFLFHLYSKMPSHTSTKELNVDFKLPSGFFALRENTNNSNQDAEQDKLNKEVVEHFKSAAVAASNSLVTDDDSITNKESIVLDASASDKSGSSDLHDSNNSSGSGYKTVSVSQRGMSRIEIKSKKRKSNQDEIDASNKKKTPATTSAANTSTTNANTSTENGEEELINDLLKPKKKPSGSNNTSANSGRSSTGEIPVTTTTTKSPPSKRNKLTEANNEEEEPKPKRGRKPKAAAVNTSEEIEEEEKENEENDGEEKSSQESDNSKRNSVGRGSRRSANVTKSPKTSMESAKAKNEKKGGKKEVDKSPPSQSSEQSYSLRQKRTGVANSKK